MVNVYFVSLLILATVLIVIGYVQKPVIKFENIAIVCGLIVLLILWSVINGRGTLEEIVLLEVKYRSSAYLLVFYSVFIAMIYHKLRIINCDKEQGSE